MSKWTDVFELDLHQHYLYAREPNTTGVLPMDDNPVDFGWVGGILGRFPFMYPHRLQNKCVYIGKHYNGTIVIIWVKAHRQISYSLDYSVGVYPPHNKYIEVVTDTNAHDDAFVTYDMTPHRDDGFPAIVMKNSHGDTGAMWFVDGVQTRPDGPILVGITNYDGPPKVYVEFQSATLASLADNASGNVRADAICYFDDPLDRFEFVAQYPIDTPSVPW